MCATVGVVLCRLGFGRVGIWSVLFRQLTSASKCHTAAAHAHGDAMLAIPWYGG